MYANRTFIITPAPVSQSPITLTKPEPNEIYFLHFVHFAHFTIILINNILAGLHIIGEPE